MKILLTTTSFQDTPGKHHDVLNASGFEIVRARGPLSEQQMLDLISANDGFDGFLNGDDKITAKVIDAARSLYAANAVDSSEWDAAASGEDHLALLTSAGFLSGSVSDYTRYSFGYSPPSPGR